MTVHLVSQHLDLYKFPTGRRMFACRQVATVARGLDREDIAILADDAFQHDVGTQRLEAEWAAYSSTTKKEIAGDEEGAVVLDRLIDRVLGGTYRTLGERLDSLTSADPEWKAADRVMTAAFPAGLPAVTRLPFAEESEAVGRIVRLALPVDHPRNAPDPTLPVLDAERGSLAPDIATLGIGAMVSRLADLHGRFSAAIAKPDPVALKYGEVRAAGALGHEWLAGVVAAIIGTRPRPDASHAAERATLLAPILRETAELAALLKQRKRISDKDPVTGEVTDAPPFDPESPPS